MDWFRSVPNVIRNSAQSDHSREEDRSYHNNSAEDQALLQRNRHTERKTSREEYARRTSQPKHLVSLPPNKSNIREDILCALCGEIYSDPRLLPCLHSFCKRCLEHTVNPRSTTLTCHLCRKEITLKINGVAEFPPNFVINNLIDVEAVRNSALKPMLCSSCNEQLPATARCLDCMDFLCYACHSAHGRVRVTKDHQILTLEQLKRSDDIPNLLHRPVFCQVHKSEKVSYFCTTCQMTICRECVITTHQQNQHDYTLIDQAIDQQRNEILSLKQSIEQKLPMLNCATNNLNETQQKLESRSALIKSEIGERTPRLIKTIEEKEQSMLNELGEIVAGKKMILNKQLEHLETEYKKYEAMHKFIDQVLSNGTSAEILSIKNSICDKLKASISVQLSLDPEADDQISCDTNIETITNAIQNYGKLSTRGEVFLQCSVVGNTNSAVKGQMSQLTLVVKNQFGVETACSKQFIEAELKTPEFGICTPEIHEKTESTFQLSYRTYSSGVHQLSIKLKGKQIAGSPFAINVVNQLATADKAKTSDSTVYLLKEQHADRTLSSNSREKSIPSTSTGRTSTTEGQRSPVSYSKPLSLDINDTYTYLKSPVERAPPVHTDKTLVRDGNTPDDNSLKVKHSNDENATAKFMFSIGRRGTQAGEFHGVFGVASDHVNKRIIATDCHNNRIQVFSEDGQYLFSFGQRGNNDSEFQSPTGVGVGPNGEIVVCERLKGRIQVFNSEGVFQRRFILNQLKASTLAVDTVGRIIIADYTNCCIYVLDPILERWSKFGHFGQTDGELQYPCYVATDLKGNIYVSDMNSNKVQMYDSDSMYIRSFGVKGDKDGEFLHPTGIAIDTKGRLIIADRDNHRIQIMKSTGEFFSKFGSKGEHDGELNDTHGIAVLSNGRIAAADLKNNRIQVFSFNNNL